MNSPILPQDVRDRLRELAEASRHRGPSAGMEAHLLRAFESAQRARSVRAAADRRWVPAVAASVVLAAAVAFLVLQTRVPVEVGSPALREVATGIGSGPLEGFTPVPGASLLPQLESGSIVRYHLPVTALTAYGVEIVPDAARRDVQADLLIGQDGHARAIRLVAP